MNRKHIVVELFVVFILLLLPVYYSSIVYPHFKAVWVQPRFNISCVSQIIRSLGWIALISLIIFKNKEQLSDFGLKKKHLLKEILIALGIFMSATLLIAVLAALVLTTLRILGFDLSRIKQFMPKRPQPWIPKPFNFAQWLILFVMIPLSAFSQELVMRGYLIRRFTQLNMGNIVAILFSSILFAGYHFYQGVFSLPFHLLIGIIFGFLFVWRKNVISISVIHSLQLFLAVFRYTMTK